MNDWLTLSKIDVHVHILSDEVHAANPDADNEFSFAVLDAYVKLMDHYGIAAAVIQPFNDPWLMSMDFTVDAVHNNLAAMKARHPGRFYAFADIDVRNKPEVSAAKLTGAIRELGLDGLKIHPENSGMNADDAYNRVLMETARDLDIPVTMHSLPNTDTEACAAHRVANLIREFPDVTVLVAHMGGFRWEDILQTHAYAEMSAVLPEYVRDHGVKKTNDILRAFGPDRLVFGTDWPTSRMLNVGEIYDDYLQILSRMDFTAAEMQKIAYDNMAGILGL